ncbi:hypothetical protein FBEOM_11587 [Fusarium beomiforme]|uniref:Uncharacterized protein n=1 Tax=Fusarium beomiforme TaxID=44412 RepID=A0A9P5A9M5_9HYPO|nr:hypothetical protein FBEOM_11587 [Fusarium beomiforme]
MLRTMPRSWSRMHNRAELSGASSGESRKSRNLEPNTKIRPAKFTRVNPARSGEGPPAIGLDPALSLLSHELAIMLDSLLAWQRFFVLGIPSLVSLRERLLSCDPHMNNIATKLLFAVLCLTACAKSKAHFQDDFLKEKLQQAVSSYGQDFIFSPPTHTDSIVLCRFLAMFKPTALATSQRVAHQSVKAELYINLAYRVAERLGILPELGSPSFASMNAVNSLETERNYLLSVQGLQLIADEFFQGNFLSMSLHAFRQVLQRMQPHIHSYQVLLQTTSCSPIMMFHIKWTTATYMQIEAMAEMKQNWMNPSRLFIVVEEGEKKCLAEMDAIYQFLSGVSKLGQENEQNEIMAIRSFLELRFHTLISRLFGLGLFYISLFEARYVAGQSQSNAEFCQDEVTQMGDVINSLLTTPDDQRNSHFFTFLRHFGKRYPDKLQENLAKFVECTTLKLEYNDYIAPIRPVVLETINHCKNIMENNLLRFKISGTLHANFDEQLDLFRQCAHQLAAMVSLPGCAHDKAFHSGCVYSASSKMIYGLCDLMNSLKRQTSLVKDSDEVMGVPNTPTFLNMPTTMPAMPKISPVTMDAASMQFNSFEDWNLWPYSGSLEYAWKERYDQPYKGITTDGNVHPNLFHLADKNENFGASTHAVKAAQNAINVASDEEREKLLRPVDAPKWLFWMNPEIYVFKHGVRLEEASDALVTALHGLMQASLSAKGYEKAHGCMRVNQFLSGVVDGTKVLNENSYNFVIFGTPSAEGPWGWQIFGHHLHELFHGRNADGDVTCLHGC